MEGGSYWWGTLSGGRVPTGGEWSSPLLYIPKSPNLSVEVGFYVCGLCWTEHRVVKVVAQNDHLAVGLLTPGAHVGALDQVRLVRI